MTWWILLILFIVLFSLSMHAALQRVLLETSDGMLERHLGEKGRLERMRWLIGRQRDLASIISSKRAGASALVIVLLTVEFCGLGEGASFTFWRVVLAFVVGSVLIWVTSDVLGASLARYVGLRLVTLVPHWAFRTGLLFGKPVIFMDRLIDESVRRLTGANLRERDAEEELLRSIEETQRQGKLDEVAVEMLENVVEFADTDVSSVMTPRTEIEGIEYTDDLTAIRSFLEDAGHSRIPVYKDSLDEIDGILYVKDLISYLGEEAPHFQLAAVLREVIRIPETKHVGDLLRDFQRAEVHLAIVIDEYGGTSGLITIEDVLEEIVGEIHDEHEPDDEEEPTCIVVGPDSWKVDGRFPVHDLEDHLDIDLPEDMEPETIAGFVLEQLGRVPDPEECFDAYGYRFSVLKASDTRVDEVGIRRLGADDTAMPPEARSA